MSDKAIYSVDTITSTKDDDKIYVNTGDNIKQVKKSDLLSKLNSDFENRKANSTFSRLVLKKEFATTEEQSCELAYGHTYLVLLGTHSWYGTDVLLICCKQNTDTGSIISELMKGATNRGNSIHEVSVSGNVLSYRKTVNNTERIIIYDLNWFDYDI